MIWSLLRHFSNCLKILTQIFKPLGKRLLFFLHKYSKSVFWTVDCRWNGTRNLTLSVWESQASEYLTKMFPSWLYIWTKHENYKTIVFQIMVKISINYANWKGGRCKWSELRMVHLQWRRKKSTLSHVQLLSIHWKSPWIDLMYSWIVNLWIHVYECFVI